MHFHFHTDWWVYDWTLFGVQFKLYGCAAGQAVNSIIDFYCQILEENPVRNQKKDSSLDVEEYNREIPKF